ncbi:OmpL47-type beta-barrel domain-containing protein [Microbacterium sp.]|uniref:OmpL47-type beta-barrel domain-containing protein n=1 Tax=Microbacterium sp. TaxID=51671 RepID=UPI0027337307|nr:hypothetical protein [Microbacterium sp.]MDP3951402.1 hypothetical protein [Microbacterium sp.]
MLDIRRRVLTLAVAGGLATATLLSPLWAAPAASQAAPAAIEGAEENLGHPIANKVLSPESSQGTDADGRPLAFWVTNGNAEVPGMFQVTDILAGEVTFKQRVPAGVNSWANTFSTADGTVYFAMTEGQLYSWTPGDAEITDHGTPFAGEGIWRLAAAPDGVIYGGTYPSGLLFSFDPTTGATTDLGQVNAGETYVRSIAVDEDYVYVGSQPNAKLARYDRQTGEVVDVPLPPQFAGQSAVYDLTLAGGYLFARVESVNSLIVFDASDMSVVNIVEKITGRVISQPDPTGRYVYFRLNNGVDPVGVYKYDLQTHTQAVTGFNPNAFPGSFAFVEFPDQVTYPGYSLVMTYYNGRIYSWNETTRKGIYLGESIMEGTPNPIQAIGSGPDGKVYVSGFLSPPGMAQFDPATDAYTMLAGAGQVEGFGNFGDSLVMGRYPNGELASFDTSRPWASGTNPAAPVPIGEEQDRPHTLVQVGDQIAVSSVPKSGRHGGAITMWNPETNERTVHRNVIADQSVVSLAEHDGLLFGGTSINGGYGIEPVTPEAKLFGFDPGSGVVTFEVVPVPGAESVNALAIDAGGTLWGIAEGVLFTFDPASGEVTRSEQVFPRSGGMYGTGRGLVFNEDGYLYAVSSGSLWRVDPESWERVQLASGGATNLTEDAAGNLYYSRSATLYRWNLALDSDVDQTAPVTSATLDPAVPGTGWHTSDVAVTLIATDEPGGAGVASTAYSLDGGGWQNYSAPLTITGDGEHTLEFRSTDGNANVEATQSLTVTIDSTTPVTTAALLNGKSGRVTLTADDATSGVVLTEYRVDGGEWASYAKPFTVGKRNVDHTVEYRSVDAAGNVEQAGSLAIPAAGGD